MISYTIIYIHNRIGLGTNSLNFLAELKFHAVIFSKNDTHLVPTKY